MKKQMVVVVAALLLMLSLMCGIAAANARSERNKLEEDGWVCTSLYNEGKSDEGFAAVKATKIKVGFGWLKRLCTGQGLTESTDLANTARVCYGFARFKHKESGAYLTVTEWHVNEPVWTTQETFALTAASSIEVKGRLREDITSGYLMLTEYATSTAK